MKRLKRFTAGPSLQRQLTASRMNAIVASIEERTPIKGDGTRLRTMPNGFSYSSKGGGKGQTIKLGLTVKRATSSSVTVSPGIVSGCSVVGRMPKIDGTALDDATAPQLGITPEAVQYIALKIEVVPESSLGADGTTYEIRDGAGLVTGDIEVLAYDSTDDMEAAGQRATVSAEDGSISQNGIFIVPISHISATGTITNVGYHFGPLGIKLCSAGTLDVFGPAIAVATIE